MNREHVVQSWQGLTTNWGSMWFAGHRRAGVSDRLWTVQEVRRQSHPAAHTVPRRQELDGHGEIRQRQRTPRLRAEPTRRPRVTRICSDVLQPWNSALARPEGRCQLADVLCLLVTSLERLPACYLRQRVYLSILFIVVTELFSYLLSLSVCLLVSRILQTLCSCVKS